MRNEKRFAYQSQRIAELERQVKSLEAENKSMQCEIDRYKKIILSKDNAIDTLRRKAIVLKEHYDNAMHDAAELVSELQLAIYQADCLREKYKKEMRTLLNRIRCDK